MSTRLVWSFLLWLVAAPLAAETVRDLYSAEVPVADRSQKALGPASRQALSQVLVKVSGTRDVLKNPAIKSALGKSQNYVQKYAYSAERAAQDGLQVRFEFNGNSIVDMVTSAGAPLWTANRPVVLVWLAVDGPAGPAFVNRDSEPELTADLLAAFSKRGLPVQLPLYDLADARALRVEEIWRLSAPAVEIASRRYDRQDVLVGSLSRDAEGLSTGNWSYLSREDRLDQSVNADTPQQFMDGGVELVANAMAARYAVAPTESEAGGILMSVEGIDSYADYAAVIDWLENVELIERASVVQVFESRIQLRLQAQADAAQLEGIIQLNDNFSPVPSGDVNEQLSYRWQNQTQ